MKLTAVLVVALSVTALPGQTLLQQGEELLKSGVYAEGVSILQKAVAATPNDPAAHFALGSAYLKRWVPSSTSVEQIELGDAAEREQRAAIALDPRHTGALAALGSLLFSRADALPAGDNRTRKFNEAASWYDQLTRIDATNAQAWYRLGVISWSNAYPLMTQARQTAGMTLADPGPIRELAARLDYRTGASQTVQNGIDYLERALAIEPSSDGAMAYLNLLYRLRADMQDEPESYGREIAVADQWVQRALQVKQERRARFAAGGVTAEVIGDVAPPPPPPVPATQSHSSSPIRVGGNVQASMLIRSQAPVYPPLARQARIEGLVRLSVVVGQEGDVQKIQLVSGHPLLAPAAMEAVKEYRYKPALVNGQPVEVITIVEVPFTLEKEPTAP